MTELLKHQLTVTSARQLGTQIQACWPQFEFSSFMQQVEPGFESLELMQRGAHIARALHACLPEDTAKALEILRQAMGEPLANIHGYGPTPFFYLPHSFYIKEFALDSFDAAMQTQYELTQCFTAEFCIRPFIERYPQETLSLLHRWAEDENEHVRRLVSEGTRPRLPWAPRLREFQRDPQAVIGLLEKLKDDPVLYVRRSVSNNLNDISKDHPELAVDIAQRWQQGASPQRGWIIKQGLRSLIKQGHPRALAVLGYVPGAQVAVKNEQITPAQVSRGEQVSIHFDLLSRASETQQLMVDFKVYFVKANGQASAKVFKLKSLALGAGEQVSLRKSISLKPMTTRTLYSGVHKIEVLINGVPQALGQFVLS